MPALSSSSAAPSSHPAEPGFMELAEMLFRLLASSRRDAFVLMLDAEDRVRDWKVMPLVDVTTILMHTSRPPAGSPAVE
ncbi:MAG TPA: hypothetical protein VJ793_23625 [Anaerolineae bacterium]|nr:hypothetical protein [Anaerolineae bacterium]